MLNNRMILLCPTNILLFGNKDSSYTLYISCIDPEQKVART